MSVPNTGSGPSVEPKDRRNLFRRTSVRGGYAGSHVHSTLKGVIRAVSALARSRGPMRWNVEGDSSRSANESIPDHKRVTAETGRDALRSTPSHSRIGGSETYAPGAFHFATPKQEGGLACLTTRQSASALSAASCVISQRHSERGARATGQKTPHLPLTPCVKGASEIRRTCAYGHLHSPLT